MRAAGLQDGLGTREGPFFDTTLVESVEGNLRIASTTLRTIGIIATPRKMPVCFVRKWQRHEV
jgi:hypothetical protein